MKKRKGNYKPGPGRPKGSVGTGKFPIQKCIRFTQEQLDHLLSLDEDVSSAVRALIDADMAKSGDEGKLEGEVSQNQ